MKPAGKTFVLKDWRAFVSPEQGAVFLIVTPENEPDFTIAIPIAEAGKMARILGTPTELRPPPRH